MAKAVTDLKTKNTRILDTAMNYGFSSHANFTRVFKETYGITPDEFRSSEVQLNQFVKPDLLLNYVMVDENVPLITEGIVLEVTHKRLLTPRTFAGIKKEVPISELMGGTSTGISITTTLWNEFHDVKSSIPNLMKGGNEFGALYVGDAKEGYCTYMAGAEVESNAIVSGYEIFELPDAEYLVCGFEAANFEELTNSAVYKAQTFMENWMNEHHLIATDFAIEMYYETTNQSAYMENWMIAVPNGHEIHL